MTDIKMEPFYQAKLEYIKRLKIFAETTLLIHSDIALFHWPSLVVYVDTADFVTLQATWPFMT